MNAQQYYELLRRITELEKAVQQQQAQIQALAEKRKTLSLPK
jgi:hypothetical protein